MDLFQKTPGKMLTRQKRSMEAQDHIPSDGGRHCRKLLHCT
jgi:hypothetical protein